MKKQATIQDIFIGRQDGSLLTRDAPERVCGSRSSVRGHVVIPENLK